MRGTVLERFWAKVEVRGPDECWPWTRALNPDGYGLFWDGERVVRAHRFSYELHVAPLGELVVDHVCHNTSGCTDVPCEHRRCVNPAHLEGVTQKVNAIRGRSGDHQLAKTHCSEGHPYSPENTLSRRNGRHRVCRACNRAAQARYNSKRRAA